MVFLLQSQFLITASLCSLSVALSRFTLLATDDTYQEFKMHLSSIELIEQGFTVKPNSQTVFLIGFWISRSFNDYKDTIRRKKLFSNSFMGEHFRDSYLNGKLEIIGNPVILENPYMQPWSRYTATKFFISYKINKLIYYFIVLMLIFISYKFNFFLLDETHIHMESIFLWFKGNFFKLKDNAAFLDLIPANFHSLLSSLRLMHPFFYFYDEKKEYLSKVNESSIRNKTFPYLYKTPYKDDPRYGTVLLGQGINVPKETFYSWLERIPEHLLIPISEEQFNLIYKESVILDIVDQALLKEDEDVYHHLELPNQSFNIVIPNASIIQFGIYSSSIPKADASRAIIAVENFAGAVAYSPGLSEQQKKEYHRFLSIIQPVAKKVPSLLNDLTRPLESNPYFNKQVQVIDNMTQSLKENLRQGAFKNMQVVLCNDAFQSSGVKKPYSAFYQRDFQNIEKIDKIYKFKPIKETEELD